MMLSQAANRTHHKAGEELCAENNALVYTITVIERANEGLAQASNSLPTRTSFSCVVSPLLILGLPVNRRSIIVYLE